MLKKSKFGLVFNTLFTVVFSLALTAFQQMMQGGITAEGLTPVSSHPSHSTLLWVPTFP